MSRPNGQIVGTGKNYEGDERADVRALIPLDACVVLDVGCSVGSFGEGLMRQRPGVVVDGIEPNPEASADASKRLRHVVAAPCPEAFDSVTGPYDCITFLDVLEHLIDPWSTLSAARDLLSSSGVVVASVPNVQHIDVALDLLLRGRFTYSDWGILDRNHLRFFTRRSIVDLFESCGYLVRHLTAVEGSFKNSFAHSVLRLAGAPVRDLRTLQFHVVAAPNVLPAG